MFIFDFTCLESLTAYYRFLRPAFFMENFDGTIGSITATVLRTGLKKDTKLQLIVCH